MSDIHELTPAEQHLGDRLAALVDGELGHESRERVLAHLATCSTCKAEADAQRRLKSVFAAAAAPPPSDGLLARLQGLPAGLDHGGDGPSRPSTAAWDFDYLPSGGAFAADRGFRIHEMNRTPSSRGRRFAFVAAGAVSLAAFAIGGALTSITTTGSTVAAGGGATAGPPRTAAVGAVRGERGQETETGTPSRPAAPTPMLSPTPFAASPVVEYPPRRHAPSTVSVFNTPPALHPPLIRPMHLSAQQLEFGRPAHDGTTVRPSAGTSSAPPATVAATPPAR